jgi:hypothetical protein
MAGWCGAGPHFVSSEFIVAPQSYQHLPFLPPPTEHPDFNEFTEIDCDVFSRWAGEVVPLQMRLGDHTLASARILVGACANSFCSTFKQECFEFRFSGLPDSSKVHLEQLMSRPTQNCHSVAELFSDFMNNTPEVPTATQVEMQLDTRSAANIHHHFSDIDHIEPYIDIGSLAEQLTEAPAPAYVTDPLASNCEHTSAPNMAMRTTQRVGCNERRKILRGREQRNSMSLPESPTSRKRARTSSNAMHQADDHIKAVVR